MWWNLLVGSISGFGIVAQNGEIDSVVSALLLTVYAAGSGAGHRSRLCHSAGPKHSFQGKQFLQLQQLQRHKLVRLLLLSSLNFYST